ncbi:MAG: tryptophan--tRNA ligase [Patescibacteria group bacterium]
MNDSKKILLSGVKPTGRPHIGNYFGAIKQFIDLQDTYNSFIFVADWHAITTVQNGETLKQNTLDIVADYLALGLDRDKTVIYKQSDIAEHAELTWIFNCLTTMPYLMRAHAFKDSEAKNKEINVGLFDYPMLMASDILLYNTDVVPVGQDQKQHIEYARDTADKFNRIYGDTFKLPKALILEDVATIPGTDGRKMSKGYNNTIEIFASNEEIKKAVMSIPTDSKSVEDKKDPEKDSVFLMHKLFTNSTELEGLKKRYTNGGIGYKESKEILIKNMIQFISPLRERREKIGKDKDLLLDTLRRGGEKAKKIASMKMKEVRKKVGTDVY